nr:uncharacterized protein LOC104113715 [Nicotiana tomentosiformis]XP_033516553.1 uncharacterized protein LOC104113715 [Nicotiana tomentosiformis]
MVKGTPVLSPHGSPRTSREGTPERSATHTNEQHEDEQTVEQDAVKQLIAEHVNNALQAFVRGLSTVPPTPPPNNTATVEIPRSGLANSGSGGTPNKSRDGRLGTPNNYDLQTLLLTLQKQVKEQNDSIEKIPGIPPVIQEVDIDKYSQQP